MLLGQSRVPHGTRGLKFGRELVKRGGLRSRPAWDAWIEINSSKSKLKSDLGRVPHGTRGLKF